MEEFIVSPFNQSDTGQNVTQEELELIRTLNKASNIILYTVPYFLLFFGIPGNVISILVLNTPSMKDKLYSVFLVSLCVFNILLLLFSLPRFIMKGIVGREIYFDSQALCAFVMYGNQTLIAVSHWHLVLICTWRLLHYKDKTRTVVKYVHPTYIILILIVMWSVVYVPLIYYWISFRNEHGEIVECYLPTTSPLSVMIIILHALIPSILLVVINAVSYTVHHYESKKGLLSRETANKVSQSLLLIIMASCLQFIITVFPTVIVVLAHQTMFDLRSIVGLAKSQLAHSVVFMLLYSNSATNFLVYCLFGSNFRRELVKMLCPGHQQKRTHFERGQISGTSDISKAEMSIKYLFSDTHSYVYKGSAAGHTTDIELSDLQYSEAINSDL